MHEYSLQEAQQHLLDLIAAAHHGEVVRIVDVHGRVVQLVPTSVEPKPRKAGSARGQIKMAPDFDAPLSDV